MRKIQGRAKETVRREKRGHTQPEHNREHTEKYLGHSPGEEFEPGGGEEKEGNHEEGGG